MVTQLTLAQACEAMIRYKIAAGKSTHTISDYRNSFKKLMLFLPGSTKFTSITRSQLIDFFAWPQEEYESEPDGVAPRGKVRLAPKSILNIHTNLSALWTWAFNEELFEKNIVRTIDPPPTSAPVVETFSFQYPSSSFSPYVFDQLPAQRRRYLHLAGAAGSFGPGNGEALRPDCGDRLGGGAPQGQPGG